MLFESAGAFIRIRCYCPSFLLLWRSLLLMPSLCQHVWWWVRWYFCGWNVLCMWTVCCWWILCGIYVFGSVLVMLLSTIHRQCGMPMCLICLFFNVLVLLCPLVLVEFFYSQTVRSDGHMPKNLELHCTDATGWLLFQPVVGVCPTMTAEILFCTWKYTEEVCLEIPYGQLCWISMVWAWWY